MEDQHSALLEEALEAASSENVAGDTYERILLSTPDTTRDIVRHIVVEKQKDGLTLERTLSMPAIAPSDILFPGVSTASELQQPQGFRRDFINDIEEHDVDQVAPITFLSHLLTFNSQTLYSWVEKDLESDCDSDMEDDELPRMGFTRYGPDDWSLFRRRQLSSSQNHGPLASNRKTYFTLFKCFVATGILFLPSGFKNAGLVAGLVIISVSGFFSYCGMLYLLGAIENLNSREPSGPSTPLLSTTASAVVSNALFPVKPKLINTYSKVGGLLFGWYGRKIIETSVLFSQVGFCCVYISFTGKSLKDALNSNDVFPEGKEWPLWLYMLLTIPIVAPLTYIRHLAFFSTPNLIANIFVVCSLGLMLGTAIDGIVNNSVMTDGHVVITNWTCTSDKEHSACLWIDTSSFMMFLGTSVYAFEGITMVIPIKNSMEHPEDLPKMLLVVIFTVTCLFALFGSLNFIAYGQETEAVIISNLPKTNQLVVTLMFVVVAVFMFPLMIFPAARIIEKRFYKQERNSGKKWQKNFIRTNIVVLCVAIGIIGGDQVDKLVSVIGGAFCVPLALVYPPVLFLKSRSCDSTFSNSLVPAGLALFGIFASLLATTTAIAQMVKS